MLYGNICLFPLSGLRWQYYQGDLLCILCDVGHMGAVPFGEVVTLRIFLPGRIDHRLYVNQVLSFFAAKMIPWG